MTEFALGRSDCGNFASAAAHEWLITNGIGGFACGTVCEAHTRRYHGLLTAALSPPTGRTLLVSKLDIDVQYLGRRHALYSNEYVDGTITPQGFIHLESFRLQRGLPVWRYAIADALIEKRIVMQPHSNTTLVNLKILRASDSLAFTLTPLCTYRDYHSHRQADWSPEIRMRDHGFTVHASAGACSYSVTCGEAEFFYQPAWHWEFKHRQETARGLDDSEDLFRPGYFTLALTEGDQATAVLSDELNNAADFAPVLEQINSSQQDLLQALPEGAPAWIRQLTLAGDQFLVQRQRVGQPSGKTLIAGYPWFTDWGRDTMIALPGLTLSLGRFDIAADILRTFAGHVSEGMLPNRFPDQDAAPQYNSVDAALWFVLAIERYTRSSGDTALAGELYPVLCDIIAWHRQGTRYGIRVDTQDGLLTAGEPGVQLTWMDARVADWIVTPRIGKCVEINSLWFNALLVMSSLAGKFGHADQAADFRSAAGQVQNSFQRFWNNEKHCLYDVIDASEGELQPDGNRHDASLRPNQLFAVSLPHSPLQKHQQKAVVDCCSRELLTSLGLRSLAAGQPGYKPYYRGNAVQRDAAYHQGTTWAWLTGAFIDAHYRVYQNKEKALSFLEPFRLHLHDACMGQISEIFDAEPPFAARGCFAQAWSVAEILRIWLKFHSNGKSVLSG